MFKTFSTATVLGLLALSAAQAQSQKPLQAKVPFAFTVQKTTFKAGNYQLTYSQTSHILSIQGLDRNPVGADILAIPSAGANGSARLVFHCHGDNCYLAQVWPGVGAGSGLKVPQPERERHLSFQPRVISTTMAAK